MACLDSLADDSGDCRDERGFWRLLEWEAATDIVDSELDLERPAAILLLPCSVEEDYAEIFFDEHPVDSSISALDRVEDGGVGAMREDLIHFAVRDRLPVYSGSVLLADLLESEAVQEDHETDPNDGSGPLITASLLLEPLPSIEGNRTAKCDPGEQTQEDNAERPAETGDRKLNHG